MHVKSHFSVRRICTIYTGTFIGATLMAQLFMSNPHL